jgi:hypothetical protein
VTKAGQDFGLFLESTAGARGAEVGTQDLEGYVSAGVALTRGVDDAHPSASEQPRDGEGTDGRREGVGGVGGWGREGGGGEEVVGVVFEKAVDLREQLGILPAQLREEVGPSGARDLASLEEDFAGALVTGAVH